MTLRTDPVNDADIVEVIERAGQPVPTLDLVHLLATKADIPAEQVSVTRMRRILDRLEDEGVLVASGGPKRPELPGWAAVDKRDVLWGTVEMAQRIEEAFEQREAEQAAAIEHRVGLLLSLHKWTNPKQRRALGITGLPAQLKADPEYRLDHGATTWSIQELEVVVDLVAI